MQEKTPSEPSPPTMDDAKNAKPKPKHQFEIYTLFTLIFTILLAIFFTTPSNPYDRLVEGITHDTITTLYEHTIPATSPTIPTQTLQGLPPSDSFFLATTPTQDIHATLQNPTSVPTQTTIPIKIPEDTTLTITPTSTKVDTQCTHTITTWSNQSSTYTQNTPYTKTIQLCSSP